MTREEALELGTFRAMRFLGEFESNVTPERAATNLLECCYGFQAELGTPDELEGFAVGLHLVAVDVAEIARKRRVAAAATSDAPGLT